MNHDGIEVNERWARLVATIGCGLTIAIGALMTVVVVGYQFVRECIAAI